MFWEEEFESKGADGIDFMPLFSLSPIYESYSKEEFLRAESYPKSGYRFWKIVDGKKVYID